MPFDQNLIVLFRLLFPSILSVGSPLYATASDYDNSEYILTLSWVKYAIVVINIVTPINDSHSTLYVCHQVI